MYPENPTKAAIDSLSRKLGLPAPDAYSQDWEYETADPARINDFLLSYENMELTTDERFTLMILIIASFNDLLELNNQKEVYWSRIRQYILSDIVIHKKTVEYWALLDEEDIEDCFPVSPLMREIINQCGQKFDLEA